MDILSAMLIYFLIGAFVGGMVIAIQMGMNIWIFLFFCLFGSVMQWVINAWRDLDE